MASAAGWSPPARQTTATSAIVIEMRGHPQDEWVGYAVLIAVKRWIKHLIFEAVQQPLADQGLAVSTSQYDARPHRANRARCRPR